MGVAVVGEKTKKLPKHHYNPVFYLKQWADDDGRLCEFSRPFDTVKPKRTHPDGTGYVRGLYTIPGVAADRQDDLETKYLRLVDDYASQALTILRDVRSNPPVLPDHMRLAWSRFLYTMMLRNPEYLAQLKDSLPTYLSGIVDAVRDDYANLKTPNHPETFEQFRQEFLANSFLMSPLRLFPDLVRKNKAVAHICNEMTWSTIRFDDPAHTLLTSDRPIVMTNGLVTPGAHIAMPISPWHLFLATNSLETREYYASLSSKELIRSVNNKVAEQSRKYVYGRDDRQLRFVSARLGKAVPSTPLESRGPIKSLPPLSVRDEIRLRAQHKDSIWRLPRFGEEEATAEIDARSKASSDEISGGVE